MPKKKRKKHKVNPLCYLFLIILFILCITPIVWLIINSFKTQADLFSNTWGLPKKWVLSNYKRAIIDGNIGKYFLNSVFISVVSVTFIIILATMASYGVTRLHWKFSGITLSIFLIGMMVPSYGSIIPLYNMFNKLHFLNHYIAVILPHIVFSLPMAILIMSGFFKSMPTELEEAAVIDGCTPISTFFKVALPIVKSGTITIAVIAFVGVWNDLLLSQIFLTDDSKMPLPIGLTRFQGLYGTDYVGKIAATVVAVIPVILVYTFLHDKIIEGMVTGAVKG